MKKAKICYSFILLVAVYFLFPINYDYSLGNNIALAFEKTISSVKEKREGYFSGNKKTFNKDNTIKILIVPGHDDQNSGANFAGIREVDLNRELAKNLYDKLSVEPGFNVVLASDSNGYNPIFEKYFETNDVNINKFIKKVKSDFKYKVQKGDIILDNENFHNTAPAQTAKRLYGINLWLNENDFDFVIHVHFNDYPGRYRAQTPIYNGFSIYIPDEQFNNHELSRTMSENIFERLKEVSAVSNLKAEQEGIIEDQELIAIGSHDALNTSSILIEYGYIYEPQFSHHEVREVSLKTLADQTYLGIKDFFGESPLKDRDKFVFKKDLDPSASIRNKENYMLQKELALAGFYPPKGKTLNDCPVSGYFGECTKKAVIDFQTKKGLKATGFVGEATRKELNSL